MSVPNDARRLYSDLAWMWPIISPPEDYIPEGEFLSRIIRDKARIGVRSLLHLGCGGGHNDYTLKLHFDITGVDVSAPMLELAKRLNPGVDYRTGDMRSVRMGTLFDAVAILDSIDYMLTEDDLRAAFETASEHLRPGGILVTAVEQTPQSFRQNLTKCTVKSRESVEITFVENYYDPDPADTTYQSTFVFLLRERGELAIETDRHLCGIFTLGVWLDSLRATGFQVEQMSFTFPGDTGETFPLLVCTKS
jgi:SAM-dependent methyltransferase